MSATLVMLTLLITNYAFNYHSPSSRQFLARISSKSIIHCMHCTNHYGMKGLKGHVVEI